MPCLDGGGELTGALPGSLWLVFSPARSLRLVLDGGADGAEQGVARIPYFTEWA
ncbi:MAG: hypothetical protein ACYC5M_13575 [Anaerolineae bacterium]